jgi:hypothetical protein
MPRCKHDRGNIQQFTEICLDCGHNIYETDAEYKASLAKDIARLRGEVRQKEIEQMEKEKEELESILRKNRDDDYNGNW